MALQSSHVTPGRLAHRPVHTPEKSPHNGYNEWLTSSTSDANLLQPASSFRLFTRLFQTGLFPCGGFHKSEPRRGAEVLRCHLLWISSKITRLRFVQNVVRSIRARAFVYSILGRMFPPRSFFRPGCLVNLQPSSADGMAAIWRKKKKRLNGVAEYDPSTSAGA